MKALWPFSTIALAALFVAGCTCDRGTSGTDTGTPPGSDAAGPGTDAATGTDTGVGPGTDAGGGMVTCAAPGASVCGNPASILRGVVRLAPGTVPAGTTGTLFVGLTHLRLGGGATGGVPHIYTTIPGADVTGTGVEFSFDMCVGGEMWSEENCEFNLIVLLDLNGNNDGTNYEPDPGEPAFRTVVTLSCSDTSPCFDVALDCTAGASCVTFADPGGCSCSAASCMSDIVTCS